MNRIASRYFLIAAVFLTLMDVHAQEQLPYRANFDVDDGFRAGNVDGQRGFSVVRGEAQVLPARGGTGGLGGSTA